jgi:hypothetical protein
MSSPHGGDPTGRSSPFRVGEGSLQRADQRRQIIDENLPQNVEVDCVVAVDEAVAEPDDLWPRYIGVPGADFVRNATGGLAHDLEQLDKGKVELPVGVKVRARSACDHRLRFPGMV